jgi:hypothetical protein
MIMLPTEMFLACGVHSYLFTIATDGTEAILVSTGTGTDWTASTLAVGGPAPGMKRCFLSGFERVVGAGASARVGLVWTEVEAADAGADAGTDVCQTVAPARLWTAIVPVSG